MNTFKYNSVRLQVYLVQSLGKWAKSFLKKKAAPQQPLLFIEGINHFYPELLKRKRALITLSPQAWYEAIAQAPDIKYFNSTGLLYEMVRTLNKHSFIVDIVDMNASGFILKNSYHIVIGHGGGCKNIIKQTGPDTKVVQYVSGAYCDAFIKETEERYERFRRRNRLLKPIEPKRKLDSAEGENYLSERADYLFTCFAPRMIENFGLFKTKIFITGLGAYVNDDFKTNIEKKDFKNGRNNFIYVGGTNGNIQKGLDLVIEAFAVTPQACLFIYCELEPEIVKAYKKELSLPNIHYIYHYRFFKKRLKQLIEKINYTIHAPINTGHGTAFTGSIGAGLIPVGYVDIPSDPSWNILTPTDSVERLIECIRTAQTKERGWCADAAKKSIEFFESNWSVQNFSANLDLLIKKVSDELSAEKTCRLVEHNIIERRTP